MRPFFSGHLFNRSYVQYSWSKTRFLGTKKKYFQTVHFRIHEKYEAVQEEIQKLLESRRPTLAIERAH
jgi:hypothetical protein